MENTQECIINLHQDDEWQQGMKDLIWINMKF